MPTVLRSHIELSYGFLHLGRHLLDIVVDTIQQSSLINDEIRQILEQVGKLRYAFGDGCDLSVSLSDGFQRHAGIRSLDLGLEGY